jgi:hypothetical protein
MADENSYTKPKSTSNAHGKVWEVLKASRKDFEGIIGQGKEMRFGNSGAFVTRDPKLAKEISEKYGYKGGTNDVIVVEREEYSAPISKNVHTVPRLPWHEEGE